MAIWMVYPCGGQPAGPDREIKINRQNVYRHADTMAKSQDPQAKKLGEQALGIIGNNPNDPEAYRTALDRVNRARALTGRSPLDINPKYLERGGIVGHSAFNVINPDRSFFQASGSDTIPAMLTPGEFVVNARAAQYNIDLLQRMNNGGQVQYRNAGGSIGSIDTSRVQSATPMIDWSEPLNRMGSVCDKAVGGFNEFGNKFVTTADNLTSAMNNLARLRIPDTIEMEGRHDVQVTINGAAVLQQLIPGIQNMITDAVAKQLAGKQGINKNSGYVNPS